VLCRAMPCCAVMPHLCQLVGKGHIKIPQDAWSDLADVCAGDVLLTELQICSMQGRKAGEFYR